jgi:hypothetical protein
MLILTILLFQLEALLLVGDPSDYGLPSLQMFTAPYFNPKTKEFENVTSLMTISDAQCILLKEPNKRKIIIQPLPNPEDVPFLDSYCLLDYDKIEGAIYDTATTIETLLPIKEAQESLQNDNGIRLMGCFSYPKYSKVVGEVIKATKDNPPKPRPLLSELTEPVLPAFATNYLTKPDLLANPPLTVKDQLKKIVQALSTETDKAKIKEMKHTLKIGPYYAIAFDKWQAFSVEQPGNEKLWDEAVAAKDAADVALDEVETAKNTVKADKEKLDAAVTDAEIEKAQQELDKSTAELREKEVKKKVTSNDVGIKYSLAQAKTEALEVMVEEGVEANKEFNNAVEALTGGLTVKDFNGGNDISAKTTVIQIREEYGGTEKNCMPLPTTQGMD